MARDVSVRELRNATAGVIAELEKGERMTLTVNRRPVADIVPHVEAARPLGVIVGAAPHRRRGCADPGLLDDLADVRGDEIDDA